MSGACGPGNISAERSSYWKNWRRLGLVCSMPAPRPRTTSTCGRSRLPRPAPTAPLPAPPLDPRPHPHPARRQRHLPRASRRRPGRRRRARRLIRAALHRRAACSILPCRRRPGLRAPCRAEGMGCRQPRLACPRSGRGLDHTDRWLPGRSQQTHRLPSPLDCPPNHHLPARRLGLPRSRRLRGRLSSRLPAPLPLKLPFQESPLASRQRPQAARSRRNAGHLRGKGSFGC